MEARCLCQVSVFRCDLNFRTKACGYLGKMLVCALIFGDFNLIFGVYEMYAVILTGGKQYKVKEGDTLKIEKLELDPGEKIEFDVVLLAGKGDDIKIGAPHIEGAKVIAEVIEQARDKKIKILKFKRRKHHMKRMGHRQYITKVKIIEIQAA